MAMAVQKSRAPTMMPTVLPPLRRPESTPDNPAVSVLLVVASWVEVDDGFKVTLRAFVDLPDKVLSVVDRVNVDAEANSS
jgi:hypothetical protein